jgi:hypothetical protein
MWFGVYMYVSMNIGVVRKILSSPLLHRVFHLEMSNPHGWKGYTGLDFVHFSSPELFIFVEFRVLRLSM